MPSLEKDVGKVFSNGRAFSSSFHDFFITMLHVNAVIRRDYTRTDVL